MIFSASCVYRDILCIIHCRQSKRAIIWDHGHPYELPDLWLPNSPDLIQLTTKSEATCLRDKSAECERSEAASYWYVSLSVTERYRWWHWPVTKKFTCLHSSHRRTLWLFIVTYRPISQNVINCNKFSWNLLLNKIFVSDCRLFPDI